MKTFLLFPIGCFIAILLIVSCGRDDSDSPLQPPVTDSVPGSDTQTPVTDSLPDGWTLAVLPDSSDYVLDVFFGNNTTGYAATLSGILKSVDGGKSWQVNAQQVTPVNPTRLVNLAVTTDDKVFGVPFSVCRSVQGNPFVLTRLESSTGNGDVFFTSNDTGYATGNTYPAGTQYCIWKTTDGGDNWFQSYPYSDSKGYGMYKEFSFSPEGYGYQILSTRILYKKGGDTVWHSSAGITTTDTLISVSAPAGNVAYAVTRSGIVYKSNNGGETFSRTGQLGTTDPAESHYCNLHFTDENTGYATFGHFLMKTTNGGSNWQVALRSKYALTEVHFTDAGHGWVGGGVAGKGHTGRIIVYKG